MGIFDLFGKREPSMMTLDAATLQKWPDRLLRRQGLDKVMRNYARNIERARGKVENAKEQLSDPRHREDVPERAHSVYDEHLPVVRNAIEDLLLHTVIGDNPFQADNQQEGFQEALVSYHEVTSKSVAALKEFLTPELQLLSDEMKGLEDTMVNLLPELEKRNYSSLKELKLLIVSYDETREKDRKLQQLRELLLKEVDALETKRIKHKERIAYFMDRARDNKYKELIAEEEELLEQVDEIKVRGLSPEEQEKELEPLKQRLAWIRKQMIHDITAMNINEQRTFLEATKDDIRLRKRKLERVDELLHNLSFDTYKQKFLTLLAPFNVRIEDVNTVLDTEDDDVAPQ
ncbi:hypothetical protein GOV07_01305 [Candidatus Woesearchaeota archaeon]|nr:hypothetical protein [Candidatus Woesearchaeota archaeon]